ncbi:MAG: D-glycero-alpha-D-manno-heptose-1,7-bisphosphate 7-phosphatase [Acidobacteriota bacterium]
MRNPADSSLQPKPAVFFDRDGTLIEETQYLTRREDLRVYPAALEAVRQVNQNGRLVVVITNQSAVARGLLSEDDLRALHGFMSDAFQREGARIDAFFYCPHHPEAGNGQACDCRKPQPGLIKRAQRELNIDLNQSYLVGDKLLDVMTARRAGCKSILVKTGYGQGEWDSIKDKEITDEADVLTIPDRIVEDVLEAVEWILRKSSEEKIQSDH